MCIVPPGPPENVTTSEVGATWALVRWWPPLLHDLGNPPAKLYRVSYEQLPGTFHSTNETYINVTGLLPANEYKFTVKAVSMALGIEQIGPGQTTSVIKTNLSGTVNIVCVYCSSILFDAITSYQEYNACLSIAI